MGARDTNLEVRTYGRTGPAVVVLHGGPAAVGEVEPVARGLSRSFRVFEPYQRGSGAQPLTVDVHIADLDRLIRGLGDDTRPAVVGHSWGAMLALACASAHPDGIAAIVLVGCGTFDPASRRTMEQTIDERLEQAGREQLRLLAERRDVSPEERVRLRRALTAKAYAFDPVRTDEQLALREPFDVQAHRETWDDMLRLQREGVYPAAFSRIRAPVLMLHGSYDPHPGRMIWGSLKHFIPQLEYHELANCGHLPWQERRARKEFFMVMTNWLLTHGDSPEYES